jgi:hypothetical protein
MALNIPFVALADARFPPARTLPEVRSHAFGRRQLSGRSIRNRSRPFAGWVPGTAPEVAASIDAFARHTPCHGL